MDNLVVSVLQFTIFLSVIILYAITCVYRAGNVRK